MNIQLELKKFVEASIDIKVNKFFKLSFIKDEAFVIWTDGLGNHKQSLGFTKDNPLLVPVKHIWDEINDIIKYHFKSGLVYIYATPQNLQFGLELDTDLQDSLQLPKNSETHYINADMRGYDPNYYDNYNWLETKVKTFCNGVIAKAKKDDVRHLKELLNVVHTIESLIDSSSDEMIQEVCEDILDVRSKLQWCKTYINNKHYFEF